jgi:hypothetical protein
LERHPRATKNKIGGDLMEIRIKDDSNNVPKTTTKEVSVVKRAAAVDSPKSITVKHHVVYSTEEFVDLKGTVERAGGRIRETLPLRNGHGISCVIEVPIVMKHERTLAYIMDISKT